MMLENFGVSETNWREALTERGGAATRRRPISRCRNRRAMIGRAVAALAADPDRGR